MEKFINNIEDLIRESEHTLNEIEKVIFTKRYNMAKKHIEIFAVQSISMIYAIWEGFIQKSFTLYINELNNLKLSHRDFHENIQVYYMETKFQQFKNYPLSNHIKKVKFFVELNNSYEASFNELKSPINTESNVNFKVLNKILDQFCLTPFKERWGNYSKSSSLKDLLNDFIRFRNSVSHGGDLSSEEKINQETYNIYKQLVIDLMYEIQNKFEEAIKNKSYLKNEGGSNDY